MRARRNGAKVDAPPEIEGFLIRATLLREFPGLRLEDIERLPRRAVRGFMAILAGEAQADEDRQKRKK